MYVTHPSEVEQPRASRKQNSGEGGGARRRPEAISGKRGNERVPVSGRRLPSGKGGQRGREGADQLASGVPASTVGGESGQARATPSSSQAGVGVAPAVTARGSPLRSSWGPPRPTSAGQVSGKHPAGGVRQGVRAGSSQSPREASAPGPRPPPRRESVTGPRPDSPHCLERSRRRPRPQEDGGNRRGQGRVRRKRRQGGGFNAPQLALQVLPSGLGGKLPGPPGEASSNEACASPNQRSCQGEEAGKREGRRTENSGDLTSTAREPTTTSAKKLLPSRRRAAVTDERRRAPSQMSGWPAPALC